MTLPPPNRIAVYLHAAAALLAAAAPIVANLDLTSTVGVSSGLAAFTVVLSKWLSGWQNHEDDLRSAEWHAVDEKHESGE